MIGQATEKSTTVVTNAPVQIYVNTQDFKKVEEEANTEELIIRPNATEQANIRDIRDKCPRQYFFVI